MVRSKFVLLGLIALMTVFSVSASAKGGVEVSLSNGDSSFADGESVSVNVKITNTGRSAVRLLKWFTPIDGLEEPLFRVSIDGREVEFVGPHYKRPEPRSEDFYLLKGGQSVTRAVNLSEFYDFSQSGNYTVEYNPSDVKLARNIKTDAENLLEMKSGSLSFYVEGRPVKQPESSFPEAVTGSTTYTKCTTTQAADAGTARTNASNYAANALSYLNVGTVGARYTTWFGTYDANRYNTVKNHFANISSAMDGAPVNINCGCKKTYYAYVYPNQPYTIYVCKAFWSAPMTGTDSKAGTLIHEMSHFTVVAGTDDWVYGQSGAKNLAITNPTNAIDNADSHEYFAENTPFQN